MKKLCARIYGSKTQRRGIYLRIARMRYCYIFIGRGVGGADVGIQGAYCVEQVVDSSRFFAVRVVDGKRKAILGVGFEDRSDAFDFGVSLQAVQKHGQLVGAGGAGKVEVSPFVEKKDYSLKEGQTISITIGVGFFLIQTPGWGVVQGGLYVVTEHISVHAETTIIEQTA